MTMEQANKMVGFNDLTRVKRNNYYYKVILHNRIVKIIDSKYENRLRLYFYQVPSVEIRVQLKKYGFRWSVDNECWVRFRSGFAFYIVKKILEIEGP